MILQQFLDTTGNNSYDLVLLVNKEYSTIDKTEIVPVQSQEIPRDIDSGNQDVEVQIRGLRDQIAKIKSQIEGMSDNLKSYVTSYLENLVYETNERLRDDLRAATKKLQDNVSKNASQFTRAEASF